MSETNPDKGTGGAGQIPPPQANRSLATGLRADQRGCWQGGERVLVETYLERYPALRTDPEGLLDLIYNEVMLREERQETPQLDEYLRRFPHLAAELRLQFDVHRLLEKGLVSTTQQTEHSFSLSADRPTAVAEGSPVRVPGYEVLGELGHGGMGVVYKARHLGLNRLVALKMLKAGAGAGEHERARFAIEAEAVARLRHPQIVQIYEVGEWNGQPYLALEYVEGVGLEAKLTGTPLPVYQTAQLVEELARAIDTAHQQGVIHRDLKPSNVLLSAEGTPRVTDFGLAKFFHEGAGGQTQSGDIVGTPSYMAPEQAQGQSKQVGPAADIYALGAILYEMLTGRPPFQGADTLATLLLVKTQEPVAPHRFQPKTPSDIETICLKCLEKEPRKRYASAEELADDLARFRRHEPIHARPIGYAERVWRWCQRNKAAAALVGTLAVLALVIVVGTSVSALILRQERDNVRKEEKEKTQNLWNAYLSQAHALRLTTEAGRRFKALTALDKALELIPVAELTEQQRMALRNETIACLSLADLEVAYEWEEHAPVATQIAFDGASKRYARGDKQGNIIIYRVSDNQEVLHLPQRKWPVGWLRFSPNGKYLAATYADLPTKGLEFLVWDCERREPVSAVPVTDDQSGVSFSWDSRRFALGRRDGSIDIIDLTAPGNVGQRLPKTIAPHHLAFHPDGKRIAVGSERDGLVQVRDIQTGQVLAELTLPGPVIPLAWSAQGNVLAIGCACKIFLFDGSSLDQVAILEGHQNTVLNFTFNYEGDVLASWAWDGSLRLWDLRAKKQLVQTLTAHINVEELQFSTDDRLLAWTTDGSKVRFWVVSTGRECRRFGTNTETGFYHWVRTFSLNGRLLATGGNGVTRLWDWTVGNEIAVLPGEGSSCADGQSLLLGGSRGLFRWDLRPDPQKAGDFYQIGSSQCLWKKRGTLCDDGRAVFSGVKGSKYEWH